MSVDLAKLRGALRRMDRGNLLLVAERAIELVPRSRLAELVGDMVRLEEVVSTGAAPASLLEEARRFHAESLAGKYYESFLVTSKNCMDNSRGTEAFMAELDRLVQKCVRASAKGPRGPVREAFDLFFAVLRRIDEGMDDVVFFADEGGSWALGVDWKAVLPAYFACLAETAGPEEFARDVERAVSDFVDYDRARFVAEADRVANEAQRAMLATFLGARAARRSR